MTHIAITAGGTAESIDGVRKLTNVSTGRLGWECLKAVIAYYKTHTENRVKIHYIFTETAFREELQQELTGVVDFYEVTDTQNVYNTVNNLTQKYKIDYFIHSMAISDFTFDYAISKKKLAEQIWKLSKNEHCGLTEIEYLLDNPTIKSKKKTKISSKSDIFISLKQTPKVISLIKENNPNTCLVGFKLLRNVSEKELQQQAINLTNKNGCDYVFANELSTISTTQNHTGILVHKEKIVARPIGKKEIAQTLVEQIIGGKK